MAEATILVITDVDMRKHGEQTGLDTLVVHAVNDECYIPEPLGFEVRKLTR